MKLQAAIDNTDLEMTEMQVKAFFLGVLCAEKPLPVTKAISELLSEAPGAIKDLEAPLKTLFEDLKKNLKAELTNMFPQENDIHKFMEISRDQLDYFLMAMSLSGTHAESCDDEELAELIDELEDSVEDMDNFLSEEDPDEKEGEDFKVFLLGTWKDFVATK